MNKNGDSEIRCGNCVFFVGNKDKHGEEGHCFLNPPNVFTFLAPRPGIVGGQQQMQIQHLHFRPSVTAKDWRGYFRSPVPEKSLDNPAPESLK